MADVGAPGSRVIDVTKGGRWWQRRFAEIKLDVEEPEVISHYLQLICGFNVVKLTSNLVFYRFPFPSFPSLSAGGRDDPVHQ